MSAVDKMLEVAFGPLDPAPAYRYYVEVENELTGSFVECSGIAARREVLEIREGGLNTHTHKLPGRISYGTLTLKKGVMYSSDMWDWFQAGALNYQIKYTSMSIIHFASQLFAPARWYNVLNVYPVSWQVTDFNADSSTYAVDTLEIAFSTIEVETMSLQAAMSKLGL